MKVITVSTFQRLIKTFFDMKLNVSYMETKNYLKMKYNNITYIAYKEGGNNDL